MGYCSSLETVICLATTPPKTEHDMYGAVFSSSTYESATLYVPFGCSQAYANAYDWKQFTHIEELPEHTDIDESPAIEVSVFPNPASDFVNISCGKIRSVQVFSIDGKMIRNISVQSDEIQVDMSNLPDGTYLFIIGTETGTTTRKIIKK